MYNIAQKKRTAAAILFEFLQVIFHKLEIFLSFCKVSFTNSKFSEFMKAFLSQTQIAASLNEGFLQLFTFFLSKIALVILTFPFHSSSNSLFPALAYNYDSACIPFPFDGGLFAAYS